jgi:hypothetical protein
MNQGDRLRLSKRSAMVGMVLTTIDPRLPADRPALLPAR